MPEATPSRTRKVIESVGPFLPWVLSLYLLYRLEQSGVWTADTPFRELMSVGVLVIGLAGSFGLHTYLRRGV